ncbi:Probable RNA-directed DNA polymerase from transposon X-element [Eumeta japonica]|uniref:Probable RNA-directed DNA polymerase from transposon X-element n=1 Tax=Eumeta variegata TaxID=151549 RepID=A0A4C1Z004_EUMVA|nr:Probable RNA-directed DNA polymerase from transposon X-element [Eumeta japonica]
MTYACPVFAHAAPNIIKKLQKIQNKFCRRATDAHWCVKNSELHGDLELPIINKFMKDASKRFFDMAQNHPNPLIVSAATYEPPPAHHFFKKTTECSVRSAGRPHIGGRKARRSKKHANRLIGQSRAVSITMLPAAFDKDVKAYGLTAVPFLCFFGGFLVCESRTHLCGRPIMGFFSSFSIPLARGKLQKKKVHPTQLHCNRHTVKLG